MDTQALQGPGKTRESKYLWLLLSLLAVALLIPIYHELTIARVVSGSSHLLGVLFVLIMICGVRVVSGHPLLRMVGTGLWIAALVTFVIETSLFHPETYPDLVARTTIYLMLLAGLVMLTLMIFVDLFHEEGVTRDRLRGAACAYLLMGLGWALAYGVLDIWIPDSFVLSESIQTLERLARAGAETNATETTTGRQTIELGYLTYYSYVTLTTVGYGDITPVRPVATTFAWLEGFVGQFYLTVLVAFLVGKRLATWMAESGS